MNNDTENLMKEGNMDQMQTQIESMLNDVIQEDDLNHKQYNLCDFNDFNPFNDFNTESLFQDDIMTNISCSDFKREMQSKPCTMKASNTLLSKHREDFDINQRQKRSFPTMNITNYPSIGNNPLPYQMPMPMNMPQQMPMNMQYQEYIMQQQQQHQQQESMRNYYQKKTFNCPMPIQSTFIQPLMPQQPYNNMNQGQPQNYYYRNNDFGHGRRFNTTQTPSSSMIIPPPLPQQASIKTMIREAYLTELEMLLIKTKSIDYCIYQQIKGNLLHLLKTQIGSRILQKYLSNTPPEIIHLLFEEISDKSGLLLLDPYANYFCLKLFCCLNPIDRLTNLSFITKSFCTLSLNKIATYPIQCIVGNLKTFKEKEIIVSAIKSCLLKLAMDIYGTHVLEKVLICFEYDLIKEISSTILDSFPFLANNANGLCVIKKLILLEYKNLHFPRLKQTLMENSIQLIQNPYGNYAIQIAIDYWEQCDVDDLVMTFIPHATQLSTQKYSSNVIERCIGKSELFLKKFIKQTCSIEDTIGNLMKNNYGNYVIQTALKNINMIPMTFEVNESRTILSKAIEANLDVLGEKKLINKWKGILTSCNSLQSHQ